MSGRREHRSDSSIDRGAIDGEPFVGALMAQGDGTHRLPVKAALRKRSARRPARPSTSE
jgi:hypothetical protein